MPKLVLSAMRGTRADQPLAADVIPGTLYYVTDESTTEQSRGGVWLTYADVDTSVVGGWIEGLMRALGDGATTVFPLPDVAESILFASIAGAVTDPLNYTLTGTNDSITFSSAPAGAAVITVNYVTAGA